MEEDHKSAKFLFLVWLLALFASVFMLYLLSSCRSQKHTVSAEYSSVKRLSTEHEESSESLASDSRSGASISFDSIDIFIERTWRLPYFQNLADKSETPCYDQSNISDQLYEVNFANIPIILSESISLRGANMEAKSSSESNSRKDASLILNATDSLNVESDQEVSDSSSSVKAFNPPNLAMAVFCGFLIFAILLFIFCFIRSRKKN